MPRTIFVLLLSLAALPALANDSTAERAAGGLVLRQSDSIDMLSEDLYISAEQVRVQYVFRNQSDADIRTIVAFPMPDRDLEEDRYGDVAYPADFVTEVAGDAVEPQVEIRAFRNDIEHTALLQGLGVPLRYEEGVPDIIEVLAGLSREDQLRLEGLALVERSEYQRDGRTIVHIEPLWTVRETWFWEQNFPAGQDLHVSHSYAPGIGGASGSSLTYAGFQDSEYGQEMIARYCADANFLAGAERMARDPENLTVFESYLSYVLTTGGNWRAPIGEFRMIVDKGDPRNIVSFCGEGVRKISPTQFEIRHSNWRPDRDLGVLILTPVPNEN